MTLHREVKMSWVCAALRSKGNPAMRTLFHVVSSFLLPRGSPGTWDKGDAECIFPKGWNFKRFCPFPFIRFSGFALLHILCPKFLKWSQHICWKRTCEFLFQWSWIFAHTCWQDRSIGIDLAWEIFKGAPALLARSEQPIYSIHEFSVWY